MNFAHVFRTKYDLVAYVEKKYSKCSSDKGLRKLRGLKLLHTNVCSLPKKLVDINFLVNKYQLDILSINETHLDTTINDFELKMQNARSPWFDNALVYDKQAKH